MIVGIPKEIKTDEYRVSMTPAGVHELVTHGHKVLVENKAGEGSGILNQDYLVQGAEIVERSDLFCKKLESQLWFDLVGGSKKSLKILEKTTDPLWISYNLETYFRNITLN